MSKLQVDQLSKTSAGADTFVLPAADGTADQTLKTDGSGQLGWSTPPVFTGVTQMSQWQLQADFANTQTKSINLSNQLNQLNHI